MKIVNLTNKPLSVTLNTGRAVLLGPMAESDDIELLEVTGNNKVEKLLSRRIIHLPEKRTEGETPAELKAEKELRPAKSKR